MEKIRSGTQAREAYRPAKERLDEAARRLIAQHLLSADRLAGALATGGIERGDRVGLLLHNGPEFVEAFLACLRLGVAAVPVQGFTDHPEQWRHVVRFAFCKRDEVLDDAIERLHKLA